MREFNTSGPNNPDIHFTVMREALMQEALDHIQHPKDPKGGRYFTLYAPRQTGKTTFVENLTKRLGRKHFFPVVISFEALGGADEPVFFRELGKLLERRAGFPFAVPAMENKFHFVDFLADLKTRLPQKLCLIIDEFDGLVAPYLGDVLHLFRDIYQARDKKYNLHSLILIGVRNLTEINLDYASPFNTNDEIRLEFFTRDETYDLMAQYEAESGQNFTPAAKARLYYETQGQPGLINALCRKIVEEMNPGLDKPITPEITHEAVDEFIHVELSKNVSNVLNKARQVEDQVIELFDTTEKVGFHIDLEWQKFLWVYGVIDVERNPNGKKYVKFSCPLYQKKLYHFFKPRIREKVYFQPIGVSYKSFLDADGNLNLHALIQSYQAYVNRRGKKAFAHARKRKDGRRVEAAYHYSLDAFLTAAMENLSGQCHVEFPTGNGKTDIFLFHNNRKYILEIKNFSGLDQLIRAKGQAADYAKSEGLREAHIVVFTEVHPRETLTEAFDETIGGVALKGVLVNVNFDE